MVLYDIQSALEDSYVLIGAIQIISLLINAIFFIFVFYSTFLDCVRHSETRWYRDASLLGSNPRNRSVSLFHFSTAGFTLLVIIANFSTVLNHSVTCKIFGFFDEAFAIMQIFFLFFYFFLNYCYNCLMLISNKHCLCRFFFNLVEIFCYFCVLVLSIMFGSISVGYIETSNNKWCWISSKYYGLQLGFFYIPAFVSGGIVLVFTTIKIITGHCIRDCCVFSTNDKLQTQSVSALDDSNRNCLFRFFYPSVGDYAQIIYSTLFVIIWSFCFLHRASVHNTGGQHIILEVWQDLTMGIYCGISVLATFFIFFFFHEKRIVTITQNNEIQKIPKPGFIDEDDEKRREKRRNDVEDDGEDESSEEDDPTKNIRLDFEGRTSADHQKSFEKLLRNDDKLVGMYDEKSYLLDDDDEEEKKEDDLIDQYSINSLD